MLLPSIFGENLFDDFLKDDWMFPSFTNDFFRTNSREPATTKPAPHLMKTDVQEHEDHYEVAIDLPGFKKEDLSLELHEGYLTVSASKAHEQDQHEGDKPEGKVIRQERYSGSMTRSYYVGEGLTEEDIKARYEHGVLYLTLPKKETPKVPEKKTIMIEG